MFDLEWKLNGRKVRPDQMEKELMKLATKNAQTQLKENIESQRCRKHGKTAKLISTSGNSFKRIKIEGCCDEFVEKVCENFTK